MSRRTGVLTTVFLIAASVAAGFFFRSRVASSVLPPPERMQAETTQSYRYAKMFSMSGHIPEVDTLVMHPRGMNIFHNSIFEEYIAGGVHRVVGGDFDDFIRAFALFFPLLVIPMLYLWMRGAGFEKWTSLLASALYGFLLPAILRARGGSLYRETVALPMLVALGWLTERTLAAEDERAGMRYGVSAGVLLFLSLAAWKVTAFISFFLLLYLLWRNWRRGDVPLSARISLASAQIVASVLLPHMRHDGALISPATVMAVFLLLPRFRPVWYPLCATVLAAASSFIGQAATGHVSSVIAAKLRFLFSHPDDPSLLSEDARLFWVPGYTSPSPAQFLFLFGVPLLAALPGIRAFFRDRGNRLIFWFLPLSLAGYLFFDRLMVFLAVALVPVIAAAFRRKWLAVPVVLLIILQSLFPGVIAGAIDRVGLRFEDSSSLLGDRELDSLLDWLERETESDQAVLSYWHISGLVSAYAERPVVTHTFFESEYNRETVIRFAGTMFMPEDSLVAFMRERDCRLLIYQADFLLDRSFSGLLYLAGLREDPEQAVARQLHYRPETLDSLVLLHQGPSLRVYGRGHRETPDLPRQFLFVERYAHCYSGYDEARSQLAYPLEWSNILANRAVEMRDLDMLSGALLLGLQGGLPEEDALTILNDLIQLYIQGSYRLDHLAEDIESFTWWIGERPALRLLMARLFAAEGRPEESREEYSRVLEEDPGNREASRELELLEREMGGMVEDTGE